MTHEILPTNPSVPAHPALGPGNVDRKTAFFLCGKPWAPRFHEWIDGKHLLKFQCQWFLSHHSHHFQLHVRAAHELYILFLDYIAIHF